jgi:flagellum-specific peptidoglycan hydrolase FlgJ
MNDTQKQWLDSVSKAAEDAAHIFPSMAACEAALESAYGQSSLARNANNLFGTKQHKQPIFDTLSLPTKEFINGQWVETTADWVKYPQVADCFADRMATLHRLAPSYPHYAAALVASDAQTFVAEVSKTWSTDPNRAAKVISIFNAYLGVQQ